MAMNVHPNKECGAPVAHVPLGKAEWAQVDGRKVAGKLFYFFVFFFYCAFLRYLKKV